MTNPSNTRLSEPPATTESTSTNTPDPGAQQEPPKECQPKKRLTKHQFEIARLRSEGLSEKAIAEKLHVEPTTINSHLRNIHKITGCHNAAQLTRWVIDKLQEQLP